MALLLAAAEVALTPWVMGRQMQALATDVPGKTPFMQEAIADGHPVRRRQWVPLTAIAPVAACAVVLGEDERFFEVGALNWRAQRALMQRMLRFDFSRGGSGISQQLARNLFLTSRRTPRRKAREYLLAYELSHALSKERMLELYLNVVEWGDGIWGIEAASQHYFGVPAARLTTAQGVAIASFLPAPRRGLQYVLGPLATRRQEGIVRKLWLSRLLSDSEYSRTLERLREWRIQTLASRSAREGTTRATALMGPEPPSFGAATQSKGALPLSRLCNARRRGL